jgi:transposase
VRSIGLDVHRDFCEVAVVEGGVVVASGRVETTPEALGLFAESLGREDRVALEVSGNAWEIARVLEPHVARVLWSALAIRASRRRARRLTGSTRARWRGCWRRARWTRCGCPTSAPGCCAGGWRRAQLVRSRTRAKNEVHAVLMRRLKGRPPASDLFGLKGRAWLAGLELPLE